MKGTAGRPEPYLCCEEYDRYREHQGKLRQSRRHFLSTAVGALAAGAFLPSMFLDPVWADRLPSAPTDGPILVVIQLAGGNDGLNTIVPYGSGLYYQDRPTIGVPARSVIPIDNAVGLHPNLQALKPLYDLGKVAIVQGVGYPNPDRSHFRSTSIWETADPTGTTPTGWLGRYLDAALADVDNPLKAVALGPLVPQTLLAERTAVPSIESLNTFRFLLTRQDAPPILAAYRAMYGGTATDLPEYISVVRKVEANADQGVRELQSVAITFRPSVTYPLSPLGRELQLVAQMIAANLGTRIFHVTVGGFDDHAAEVYTHATLLKDLGDSVAAFYQDLTSQGKGDQVLLMTFSEFGRRVKENAGRGTDHGTAAPLLVVGGKVRGGIYGDDPILSNLDDNGDLIYGIDFRSVYGTIIDSWLGGSSQAVLNGSFERIPFL